MKAFCCVLVRESSTRLFVILSCTAGPFRCVGVHSASLVPFLVEATASRYWSYQVAGWLGYSGIGTAINLLNGAAIGPPHVGHVVLVVCSIGLTHVLGGGRLVVGMFRRSLNALEQQLDETIFFRANRRQILSLNTIERTTIGTTGSLTAVLRGGIEVELSRRQSDRFRQLFSL